MTERTDAASAPTAEYLREYDDALRGDPVSATMLVVGWLRTDWRRLYAELRAHRPILVTPAFTLVTSGSDVRAVLSLPQVFTVVDYARRLDAALGAPCVLTQDVTPLKWRERGLLQAVLDADDLPRVRAMVGRAADEALDRAAGHGRIDVVGDLFRPVVLRVVAEYFGFPGPDPATMARWSRDVMGHVTANPTDDPEVRARALASGAEMMAYARGLVADRRSGGAAGPDDVLGRLLDVRTPVPPDDSRIAVNVAGTLLGFLENASGSMVNAVGQLLARPGTLAAATDTASDPDRFAAFVWEALRFDPFLKAIPRRCGRAHVLAPGTPFETSVPAGTLVLAAVASAMFDGTDVHAPDEFRTDRPPDGYLHFGFGHHDCVGGHVGAAVVVETVRRLLLRPGVRTLPGEDVERDRGIFPDRWTIGLGTGLGAEG